MQDVKITREEQKKVINNLNIFNIFLRIVKKWCIIAS